MATEKRGSQSFTNDAAHVRLSASDLLVYGEDLHFGIYGDISVPVALSAGAGLGPQTFIMSVGEFSDTLTLALLTSGAATHTVTYGWSVDGTAANVHSSGTSAWATQTGNQSVILTKKDKYLHVTISFSASQALYAYLSGRNLG